MLVFLTILFLALSFGYSFIGFALREPTVHFHEYSAPGFVEEVGGHVLFGLLAGFPLIYLGLEYFLLAGSCAILIDADHILGTLNLSVSSRPDHSILYVVVASLAFACFTKYILKSKSRSQTIASAFIPPVVILAHFAYDIFAAYALFGGRGANFPLFVPFSFTLISFPFWSSFLFEALALGIALVGTSVAERGSSIPKEEKKLPGSVRGLLP